MRVWPYLLLGVGVLLLLGKRRAGAATARGGGTCPDRARWIATARAPRPDELVTIPGTSRQLRRDAWASWAVLQAEARRAGFKTPLFDVASGYRDDAKQARIWEENLAKTRAAHPGWTDDQVRKETRIWVAPPGKSLHRSGCTVDANLGAPIGKAYKAAIAQHAAYKWMQANAARLGWCPYQAEEWHWENPRCAMSGYFNDGGARVGSPGGSRLRG